MALVVYPPSPHIVQNSRELSVKGAQHRRFCGGLPLTGGTGCSISRRRGGGISSRAASFPMTGKGRGIGLNINGGLLMNFTNSPYERMMKEIPHKDIPAPQKAPEGTPCAGCPYWREIACVFCYQERLKKQSWCVDIWTEKRPCLQGFSATVLVVVIWFPYPPSISRNTANTLNLLTAGKRRRRVENSSLKLPYSQGLTDAL